MNSEIGRIGSPNYLPVPDKRKKPAQGEASVKEVGRVTIERREVSHILYGGDHDYEMDML